MEDLQTIMSTKWNGIHRRWMTVMLTRLQVRNGNTCHLEFIFSFIFFNYVKLIIFGF